jgi:hypothetical protein
MTIWDNVKIQIYAIGGTASADVAGAERIRIPAIDDAQQRLY